MVSRVGEKSRKKVLVKEKKSDKGGQKRTAVFKDHTKLSAIDKKDVQQPSMNL